MKREYSVQTEQSLKVAHSPESCREVIFSYLFKTKKKKGEGSLLSNGVMKLSLLIPDRIPF